MLPMPIVALLTASNVFAASPLARQARVEVAGRTLTVGAANAGADPQLECAPATVQRTIRRCKLKASVIAFARSLGRPVDGITLNIHFQGEVINMAVEFAAGSGVDDVINQLKTAFAQDPKIDYWADDSHLFASYIWIDKEAEVEVTKTVKGDAGNGKVRIYVSSLLGNRPINPDDLLQN